MPLLKMFYLKIFCLVVSSVTVTGYQHSSCYDKDPFYIDKAPRNASELRCPNECNCTYCPQHDGNDVYYGHNVYCTTLQLKSVPLKSTVPTDVVYYSLRYNYITAIKDNSFSTLSDLQFLRIDDNDLKYELIEGNSFRGLKNVISLSLNKNKMLGRLLAAWFVDLVSLEILDVQNCGLTSIESNIFQNSKQLTKVHISHNNIIYFPKNFLQNLPSLNYIYMDYNKLSYIPNKAFKGSNNINTIIISDNSLSTISENVGIQNLTMLQILGVDYNHLVCDCNMVWFRKWIGMTNVTIENLNDTKCKMNWIAGHSQFLLNFDPDSLQCSKLMKYLKIILPPASASIMVVIIVILLYNFRYDIRFWIQRRRLRKQYEQLDNQGPPPINGEDIRYDAFVSYNSEDQDWVLKVLQPSLEDQRNFKLCVDYRDFIPGEAVVNNISNAVKYSRKVVVVVSKNFAKSEWCYFELEMARMRMFDNHEDILVVVLLEKVSSKHMPVLLHKILTKKTYIEWEDHPDRLPLFWAKIETALLSPNCPRERLLDRDAV